MRAVFAPLLLAALLLGGCSSSGSGAGEPADTQREPVRERTDVVAQEPEPFTRSIGRGDAPWHNAAVAIRGVLDGALRGVGRAVLREDAARAEKALAELRGCVDRLETLPPPRTARHEQIATALREACETARRGADVDARLLVQDETRFRASLEVWGDAVDAFAAANDDFPRPFSNAHLPVVSAGLVTDRTRHEPLLSSAAGELLDLSVDVRCLSQADWRAFTEEYGLEREVVGVATGFLVRIAPEICADLASFLYEDWRPQRRGELSFLADALGVYAHELRHMRGESSEARVECSAVQKLAATAVALGADAAYAARIATVYWEDVYPGLPDEYRSRDCRPDGPLDDSPGDGSWP